MRPVELPWPARALHPNARGHWAKRHAAAKTARREAFILAVQSGWREAALAPEGKLHVEIDAFPPDRRHRDWDGVIASCKSALDGLADALRVNDRRFVPQLTLHDDPVKGGMVRVRIRTLDQENANPLGAES